MKSNCPRPLVLYPVGCTLHGDYPGLQRPMHGAREFHVSATARKRYGFDKGIFSLSGNVIFADFRAAREFSYLINKQRDLVHHPEQAVRTGDINAMALIDEILHYVTVQYREQHGVEIFTQLHGRLVEKLGNSKVETLLTRFIEQFPPLAVFHGEMSPAEYLTSQPEPGLAGRELALEELLMLWVANMNPAFAPFGELFDDTELKKDGVYDAAINEVNAFFGEQPTFGPDEESLTEMLRAPAREFPDSLEDQLAYIRRKWGSVLGRFLFRLLRSLDVMHEEQRMRGFSPGTLTPYDYHGSGTAEEVERFSPDKDWMPSVVLLAKSTLVWLDQLSRSYQRDIRTLDQIPDEELDVLASRGFTGIWLIGLWERSQASKKVKQMCGNPEAEASAYSLWNYEIANELGGWEALTNLRVRCERRGMRLASDMVPNHTGIDSDWVHKHPDWFVQLDSPPFPSYSFNGENLSSQPGVGIYLEDHYYDRTDASVVFKRIEFDGGKDRYIYHGNDGTHMPWNDTAQLNFLNAEVREAVIQTVLHVARNFSIIRFDAAMTLAKRHFQRLWFPQPGSGGDIPTRAEYGLTAEQFDEAMPEEFWREVVDRVAAEVPDTLLLAEAFWMMEGYFVRTLGMHRVYNSAFMNMLKMEENAKYRRTIKNTIEFDKDILKRFVNFMNNPDEDTAIEQFGDGDKYFGVCTLMVTMPGLPMIGHGQVEGFKEKYGMEYRRAYWDETPSLSLVERHEHEIFPLMKRRRLFSEVENFFLFDLYDQHGNINENVFAYSNKAGSDRALIFYNNSFEQAKGWIKDSAGYVEKTGNGSKEHRREGLGTVLGLTNSHKHYLIMREQRSGLWFIRNSRDIWEGGLYVALRGYESQVFVDIYEVADSEFSYYAQLVDSLGGAGVPDIDEALKDVFFKPVYDLFFRVLNSSSKHEIESELTGASPAGTVDQEMLAVAYEQLLHTTREHCRGEGDVEAALRMFRLRLQALLSLRYQSLEPPAKQAKLYRAAFAQLLTKISSSSILRHALLAYVTISPVEIALYSAEQPSQFSSGEGPSRDLRLIKKVRSLIPDLELRELSGHDWDQLVELVTTYDTWHQSMLAGKKAAAETLQDLLGHSEVAAYLELHTYQGHVWFNREKFQSFCDAFEAVAILEYTRMRLEPNTSGAKAAAGICSAYELVETWRLAAERSRYQVPPLLEEVAILNGDGQVSAKEPTQKSGGKVSGKPASKAGPKSGGKSGGET